MTFKNKAWAPTTILADEKEEISEQEKKDFQDLLALVNVFLSRLEGKEPGILNDFLIDLFTDFMGIAEKIPGLRENEILPEWVVDQIGGYITPSMGYGGCEEYRSDFFKAFYLPLETKSKSSPEAYEAYNKAIKDRIECEVGRRDRDPVKHRRDSCLQRRSP
jgi:hypothetical protein